MFEVPAMMGPALALAFGCIGSAIGCQIASVACLSVISQTDQQHGKYLAISAAPSSQAIYGFILMIILKNAIIAQSVSVGSAAFIGLGSGLAILMSAVMQGKICASAIYASFKNPPVYGKAWAAIGVAESFALFAFVFAILMI